MELGEERGEDGVGALRWGWDVMFRLRNMQLGSAALATGWQRFRWKSS
jgi:hypothetical protein